MLTSSLKLTLRVLYVQVRLLLELPTFVGEEQPVEVEHRLFIEVFLRLYVLYFTRSCYFRGLIHADREDLALT